MNLRIRTISLVLLFVILPAPGSGQCEGSDSDAVVTMEMLLERTIFQVDVLTLTVRLGGTAAARLRGLADGRTLTPEVADSAARIAAHATCGRTHLDFQRDVSLDRFFDAVRETSLAAREAGFISSGTYRLIDRSLPEWYAFLDGRGIREGDRLAYRVRDDTLGIRYRSAEGKLLLERQDVGADRRRSVLGGYFAPGSDFRDGLLRSLFRNDGP